MLSVAQAPEKVEADLCRVNARSVLRTVVGGVVISNRQTRPRPIHAHLLQTLFVCVLVLGLTNATADGRTSARDRDAHAVLLGLLSASRVTAGTPALEVDPVLAGEAQRWAQAMADSRKLQHSPNLGRLLALGYDRAGENVGWSQADVDAVHRGFEGSPSHRRIMLDQGWTGVGIGVSVESGDVFVAVLFGARTPARSGPRSGARHRAPPTTLVTPTA